MGLLALAAHSWAQAVPKPVYVESFRKGPTRLAELLLVANLTAENADYKATVKDSWGNARYQLSLEPAREEGGAERVVSWRVLLIDPHRRYLGNFLVATRPPEALQTGLRIVPGGWIQALTLSSHYSPGACSPPAGRDDGRNTVYRNRSPAELKHQIY